MADQKKISGRLQSFASLNWYEESIKFIFNFVTKTSELLLAAGIVISTANFLTDGDIMNHNKGLADAWSWAQAIAIDSSLGIVFINGFQAVREREKVKAVIFFTLTALLATVAGLITHFDAYSHASGLPVSDKSISGIIPLWIMTALRAVAVIGFLLTSRLKNFSFNELRHELEQEAPHVLEPQTLSGPNQEPEHIDYQKLAKELAPFLQAVRTTIIEEVRASIAAPELVPAIEERASTIQEGKPEPAPPIDERANVAQEPVLEVRATQKDVPKLDADVMENGNQEEKLEHVYQELVLTYAGKRISGRALAKRAKIHRSTATEWLRVHHPENDDAKADDAIKMHESYQDLEPAPSIGEPANATQEETPAPVPPAEERASVNQEEVPEPLTEERANQEPDARSAIEERASATQKPELVPETVS